ncbi:Carbohydrate-binding, CenC-like protein [Artemisia annua]|uniref:Carbohydrate-binding, CenC-like protein n=1 Tax=Artemisia annua TaxID=35608 RepID=A0A2U1KVL4_ARTAN|nr:Carbohydrate-binding, CenC-like protein [Artemisia annua]
MTRGNLPFNRKFSKKIFLKQIREKHKESCTYDISYGCVYKGFFSTKIRDLLKEISSFGGTDGSKIVNNYDSNVVHPTNQNIILSTNTLDDENLVDNLDVEWICVNKECVFHHHKEECDDENIQFHNPPKEIDSQVVENIQFQIPPKEISTHNPNHPYKKDDNKVENNEKSEDRYVCYNGLWHKLKRRHVRNKDWNTMWEEITHADEWIQELGDMGKKIPEGYMVDHNAAVLDQVLREAYAHPSVNGRVLWSAWSTQRCCIMCLTDNSFRNLPTRNVELLTRIWRVSIRKMLIEVLKAFKVLKRFLQVRFLFADLMVLSEYTVLICIVFHLFLEWSCNGSFMTSLDMAAGIIGTSSVAPSQNNKRPRCRQKTTSGVQRIPYNHIGPANRRSQSLSCALNSVPNTPCCSTKLKSKQPLLQH